MTPASACLAAAVLMLVGVPCPARPIQNADGLFPTDGTLRASGGTTIVRVDTAADALRISPVTFIGRSGINAGETSKPMCGLVIVAPGHRPQGVVTVGTGVTEATPSCDAVLAVGAVLPATGSTVRRIGVIHAISSRNAANGRAVVVLRRDDAGTWSVDDDATAQADAITHATIATLRRTLR